MIQGTVNNSGINYGTQNGVNLPASLVPALPPWLLISGTVNNGFFGVNYGFQNGVRIR